MEREIPDRREAARFARRSVTTGPSTFVVEDEPTVGALAAAQLGPRGTDRRTMLIVAAVSACISFGFAGRLTGPGGGGEADRAQPRVVVADPAPGTSPTASTGGVELVWPAEGATVDGLAPAFILRSDGPLGRLRIALAGVGGEIGSTEIEIDAAAIVQATIPVGFIPFELPAMLTIGRAGPPIAPIVTRNVRIRPTAAVVLTDVSMAMIDGRSSLVIRGLASSTVSDLRLLVSAREDDETDPMTLVDVPVPLSGTLAEGWGGVLLAGGAFTASGEVGTIPSGMLTRLELRWSDAATGGRGTLARTIVSPSHRSTAVEGR